MKTRRIGQWGAAGTLAVAASVATGDFFAPGIDNGWDFNGNAMVETFAGSGVWQHTATGQTPGAQLLWDILSEAGNWDSKVHPAGNQWGTVDGAGEVTLTLDTNTYNDGWMPASYRVYTSTLASDSWAATGSWVAAAGMGNDWDLGTAPAMTLNGGLFEVTIPAGTLAAGTYDWKPVANGGWDSTGDGTGVNVNAGNTQFTIDGLSDTILQLDPSNGTVRAIPTPGALALVGVGGLAASRRRRR
jgi:MYXO-CTERM domain-containing protein